MNRIVLLATVMFTVLGWNAECEEDGRKNTAQVALSKALTVFEIDQPWETLDHSPDYVVRNRGAAFYVQGLLNTANEDRITGDFLQLSNNSDLLLETAQRIDRESGEFYRESLEFDVLRFFVELLSEGTESFRFSKSVFKDMYFSKAEGKSQPFQVVLPPDYSPEVEYPLFVQVFGSAALLPTKERPFIRVRPTGRGVWGYRTMSRVDVMQVISHMKMSYRIDHDRVYMTGTSAGATGIMHAAALRQDIFAALVPLVAFGNDLPLENFRNLSIRCEHGVNDWTSSIGNVRVQFQRLTKLGYDAVLNEHPSAGHGIRVPPPKTMDWLFEKTRDARPKHIVHTCEHPRDGKAYWVSIEALLDPHEIARIEASSDANCLAVTTSNIQRFSIDSTTVQQLQGRKLTIDGSTVNYGRRVEDNRLSFTKNESWHTTPIIDESIIRRRAYGAGSAANLFQGEPLLVIHGTGAEKKTENVFLQNAANILSRSGGPQFKPSNVRFPVRSDQNLADIPLEHYNLLVVGTTENNSYLKRIASKLPFAIDDDELKAAGRKPISLDGTVLCFHYFNPDHPNRLIYILSPYLDEAEQKKFMRNPRVFLSGSDGFKMIDQPDLIVRGADQLIQREMQLGVDWEFIPAAGDDKFVPSQFSDRVHLGFAHMKVMQKSAEVDFAFWWGPEDKGLFGGYDFNWLQGLDPARYTMADYSVRRRETETMKAHLSGEELREIFDRWIATDELITWPTINEKAINVGSTYSIVIPMDLVPKLGNRRKVLKDVSLGPGIKPESVAREIFSEVTVQAVGR